MLIPFNTTQDRRGRSVPGLWERYNISPKGILHVGGNRGEEAPVYLQLGVTKQIWIEANPEIFEQLKNTLRGNPDALAYNYAIGENDYENTILHVANNSGQSSSLLPLGTHKKQHPDVFYTKDIPVVMRRLDSLIPEEAWNNYDFLSCDVQGYEGQVLLGMGEKLKHFKWAYLEINTNHVYENCWLVGEIDSYMAKFGFVRVETKMVGNWGDALYIKKAE